MGTMHSPQVEGEAKDKGSKAVQRHGSKQKYRICDNKGEHSKAIVEQKKTKENIVGEEDKIHNILLLLRHAVLSVI